MPKENCNDIVEHDDTFYDENTAEKHKPITRNEKIEGYPLNIVDLKDVCYYTTPNFVAKNLYCDPLSGLNDRDF
jgi:hypothetical protein